MDPTHASDKMIRHPDISGRRRPARSGRVRLPGRRLLPRPAAASLPASALLLAYGLRGLSHLLASHREGRAGSGLTQSPPLNKPAQTSGSSPLNAMPELLTREIVTFIHARITTRSDGSIEHRSVSATWIESERWDR